LNYEKQFKAEHHKLEAKYEALYKPFYDKRAKVIDGAEEVKSEDIAEQLKKVKLEDTITSNEKGVPGFWAKCLKNSHQFGALISAKDEKILAHLSDVTCDFREDGSFTLAFKFTPNEFFDHPELKRDFILSDKLDIKKIDSTNIVWKSEDVNPTIEKQKKNIKNKKSGTKKTVTKTVTVPSFFSFFKSYDMDNIKKKEDVEENEDEEDEMGEDEIIEEEYELGLFIKEELIPYAIEYYLGVINDGDDYSDGEGEDFEDEEDEDDHHHHHKDDGHQHGKKKGKKD